VVHQEGTNDIKIEESSLTFPPLLVGLASEPGAATSSKKDDNFSPNIFVETKIMLLSMIKKKSWRSSLK
jgi:hypothetical protein